MFPVGLGAALGDACLAGLLAGDAGLALVAATPMSVLGGALLSSLLDLCGSRSPGNGRSVILRASSSVLAAKSLAAVGIIWRSPAANSASIRICSSRTCASMRSACSFFLCGADLIQSSLLAIMLVLACDETENAVDGRSPSLSSR
jgi:hypothetical protein